MMKPLTALRRLLVVAALLGLLAPLAAPPAPAGAYPVQTIKLYKGEPIENCADPAVTSAKHTDGYWYMYCTADPLNDADKTKSGGWNFHLIAILRSQDLVKWDYHSDALSKRPRWAAPDAGFWAPDIQYFNGKWYLYYSVAGTIGRQRTGDRSAIGVATATSPTGPWTDSGAPVVEAQTGRWVIDPFVMADNTGRYIFYGSYAGGISARKLSPDGLKSDATSEKQVTSANRYEGAYIHKRDNGYYYLFASATDCCNEQLTGYTVFAGRSTTLLGPYLDREGRPLLVPADGSQDGRVGGTPVLAMNGNKWVGPGHNAVVTDALGQDWFVYHAINRADPVFAGTADYNKRAPQLDPLDWVNDWPTVRGGLGPSDPTTDAQGDLVDEFGRKLKPGTLSTPITLATMDVPDPNAPLEYLEFDGSLGEGWEKIGGPPVAADADRQTVRFDIQPGDLYQTRNDAGVLVRPAPTTDSYIVETKVKVDVPTAGCCYNYAQAGLVIYVDNDHYIKLVNASIWETRQTEFGKEMLIGTAPRYGNTVVGPPAAQGDYTYLRIVKRPGGAGEERYTAYTSADGVTWVRGGTWTHGLGSKASVKIGLVAMSNGSGVPFTANFDYVRISQVSTAP